MKSGAVYIPRDRRYTLAQHTQLPEHAQGAVLFADISGFTPLTEALTRDLGSQRGPEELTNYLNLVFGALISDLNRFGGSTISFAGDAITCWFDDLPLLSSIATHQSAALRAVACALAMQQTMQQFASIITPSGAQVGLAMKAGIAAGPVRRFIVGDPSIQRIDILAGHTLEHVAGAEHVAERGEVVVDEPTAALLGRSIQIRTWRADGQDRYVVVDRLLIDVAETPWGEEPDLDEAAVREWLLPPIYERLRQGMGDFLAELRPVVALFLRFDGMDYDGDPAAAERLDAYVRQVQAVLARYDSYVMQVIIGDKGNMLYATFGAPTAHEDDAIRAAAAALELRALVSAGISGVQIGLSQGRMRAGAYGSTTRRTYGVLGDEVNLAARLMQRAQPGQIIVAGHVRSATGERFIWENLPATRVKGKQDLIEIAALIGLNERSSGRLQTARYALPMIGRDREIALVKAHVADSLAGEGRLVGITGAAGLGKSRMLAEVIRLASGNGFTGLAGECQSYAIHSSYHAWNRIGRRLFGLESISDPTAQLEQIRSQLEAINPLLVDRAPLLGALIGIPIVDNDLTRHFDARLRKASLEALMVDVLRAKAAEGPLMLVIEDGQWFDPLSRDLLLAFAMAIADLPVLIVLTYRPPEGEQHPLQPFFQLPLFHEILLGDFDDQAVEQLIRAKLVQFIDESASDEAIPMAFITQITERCQGNPFYVEELINYLNDRGIRPSDALALNRIELPDTLQRVLLSRIDQLTESEKTMLKIASVVGRVFQAAVLLGAYPQLGELPRVRTALTTLANRELTQLEQPDPELSYLFKHILTQEAAYESLPFATRATLHEQIGAYIEATAGEQVNLMLDLLAFHYDRSRNEEKRREYLLRAGAAAQANYANAAAVDYYQRSLPLLDPTGQLATILKLGKVRELLGDWLEAQQRYQEGLALAVAHLDRFSQAAYQAALGDLLRKQGQYAAASEWLEQARLLYTELDEKRGLASVLNVLGIVADLQGDYTTADAYYTTSLDLWNQLDDKLQIGKVLTNLGAIARLQGDPVRARYFAEASLSTQRTVGDRLWVAYSLNNLGNLALDEGQTALAQSYLEEALTLMRQVGEKWGLGNILNNLANVVRTRGDYDPARMLYRESLLIYRDFADRWALAYLLEDIGGLAALEGQPVLALRLAGAASVLREAISSPLSVVELSKLEELLAPARQVLADQTEKIYNEGRDLSLEQAVALALGDQRIR